MHRDHTHLLSFQRSVECGQRKFLFANLSAPVIVLDHWHCGKVIIFIPSKEWEMSFCNSESSFTLKSSCFLQTREIKNHPKLISMLRLIWGTDPKAIFILQSALKGAIKTNELWLSVTLYSDNKLKWNSCRACPQLLPFESCVSHPFIPTFIMRGSVDQIMLGKNTRHVISPCLFKSNGGCLIWKAKKRSLHIIVQDWS